MTAERFGASDVQDWTSQQLMSYDACTNCGRCESECPAWATGKPLSPRKVIQDLRAYTEARSREMLGANSLGAPMPASAVSMTHDTIGDDVLWSCTTCAACVEACPVEIRHIRLHRRDEALPGAGRGDRTRDRSDCAAVVGATGASLVRNCTHTRVVARRNGRRADHRTESESRCALLGRMLRGAGRQGALT